MVDPNEIARLAAAINLLRPDWPAASVQTFITTHHRHRPLRDLAVALAWVAADPASETPKRINGVGPWWDVTATDRAQTAPRVCNGCGGMHEPDEPHQRRRPHDPDAYRRGVAEARAALARANAPQPEPAPEPWEDW